MGCCVSSEASPYPTQQPSSSSRAITSVQPSSQAALPRPSTNASIHSNGENRDLALHINKPLKLHVWSSTNKVWTNVTLNRERIEFFDTRVTGRPEIWQTINSALEVLWSGGDPGDADGGLGTAQMILNATGITVPTGDLANGVYDSFGAFYPLPAHIVSNPTNLAPVPANSVQDADGKSALEASGGLDENDAIRRREEKGKGVVKPVDLVEVGIKLSDREAKPVRVTISKDDSVRLIARYIMEETKLPATKIVRIAYMGRILAETQSLGAQGWRDDHVLNGLVFDRITVHG